MGGYCYIGKNVKLGKNVVIYENNHIEGNVEIGDNTTILPNNLIVNAKIGKNCSIHASVIENSIVGNDVAIGPFAHLRPNSRIDEGCKIGNFVEIKNSNIGKKCKISHLTYVGDCDMGDGCNIGCGVIFANYDGKLYLCGHNGDKKYKRKRLCNWQSQTGKQARPGRKILVR